MNKSMVALRKLFVHDSEIPAKASDIRIDIDYKALTLIQWNSHSFTALMIFYYNVLSIVLMSESDSNHFEALNLYWVMKCERISVFDFTFENQKLNKLRDFRF